MANLFCFMEPEVVAADHRAALRAEKARLRIACARLIKDGTADFALRTDRRNLSEYRAEGNEHLVIAISRQIAILRAAMQAAA